MKKAIIVRIAVIMMLVVPICYGQEKISLQSRVDKSTITIGDLITYSVIVTRDKDMNIQLPSLGANLGGFEIRDYKQHEPQKADNRIIDQVDYIISTFEVGEFEIPPVEIKYSIPPDKTQKVMKTESIKIVVASVKPSEAGDIREIKPPWEIPYNWRPVIIVGAIVLGVFLIAGAIIYLIRRKRRLGALMPQWAPPPRPAHEIAYERLKQLAESDLLQRLEIKQYYTEISEIIRQYVEGRYTIVAMELTSTDLLANLGKAEVQRECMALFEQFLALCDMVKFAKFIPGDSEHEAIMNHAIQIVDTTKFVEPAAPAAVPATQEQAVPVSEEVKVQEEQPTEHQDNKGV